MSVRVIIAKLLPRSVVTHLKDFNAVSSPTARASPVEGIVSSSNTFSVEVSRANQKQ